MKVKNFRVECDNDIDYALNYIRYCAYDLEEKAQMKKDKISEDKLNLVYKYADILTRLFHEDIRRYNYDALVSIDSCGE